jgi:hypothetical protein
VACAFVAFDTRCLVCVSSATRLSSLAVVSSSRPLQSSFPLILRHPPWATTPSVLLLQSCRTHQIPPARLSKSPLLPLRLCLPASQPRPSLLRQHHARRRPPRLFCRLLLPWCLPETRQMSFQQSKRPGTFGVGGAARPSGVGKTTAAPRRS